MMALWQRLFDVPVAQVLLTHDDLRNRRRYLNARATLRELLRLRRAADRQRERHRRGRRTQARRQRQPRGRRRGAGRCRPAADRHRYRRACTTPIRCTIRRREPMPRVEAITPAMCLAWPAAKPATRHRRHAHQARSGAARRRRPASPPCCSAAAMPRRSRRLRDGTLARHLSSPHGDRLLGAQAVAAACADRPARRDRVDAGAAAALLARRVAAAGRRRRASKAISVAATWSRSRAGDDGRRVHRARAGAVQRRRDLRASPAATAARSKPSSAIRYGEAMIHRDDLVAAARMGRASHERGRASPVTFARLAAPPRDAAQVDRSAAIRRRRAAAARGDGRRCSRTPGRDPRRECRRSARGRDRPASAGAMLDRLALDPERLREHRRCAARDRRGCPIRSAR